MSDRILAALVTAAENVPEEVETSLWQVVATALGGVAALIAVTTFLGGAFWWLVKPRLIAWFDTEFVAPMRETRAQVYPNGGKSTHDYAKKAYESSEQTRAALDQHVTDSTSDRAALWRAVAELGRGHE